MEETILLTGHGSLTIFLIELHFDETSLCAPRLISQDNCLILLHLVDKKTRGILNFRYVILHGWFELILHIYFLFSRVFTDHQVDPCLVMLLLACVRILNNKDINHVNMNIAQLTWSCTLEPRYQRLESSSSNIIVLKKIVKHHWLACYVHAKL